jgi:hypothetical protein
MKNGNSKVVDPRILVVQQYLTRTGISWYPSNFSISGKRVRFKQGASCNLLYNVKGGKVVGRPVAFR